MKRAGRVFLIGAGPGDPGLLTLKGASALGQAQVILYDKLVSAEILALANPNAEFIYTGKEHGSQEEMQAQIFGLLEGHVRAGRTVARLKGGDPFLFGRGAEEMQWLRQRGIDVEAIPGVSSAFGVPAAAGIPVTYRGVSAGVTVVSGRCRKGALVDWSRYARVETLVILMGVESRSAIAAALIESGRGADEPAAFVEWGSTDRERVIETTLSEIAAGRVDAHPPAVWVIGEVVKLRASLIATAVEAKA